MHQPKHKSVRATLAKRIAGGGLQPGDRLPSERDLAREFAVNRWVIREALAGLARDGMIVSAYPRGYDVLAPRIPWLSRFRLLSDEPWDVEIIDTAIAPATPEDANTFRIDPSDAVIICPFELRGATTHQPWALGLASYPVDALDDATRTLLQDAGFIDDDQLERVSGRRLVGYHERITARLPTTHERDRLQIPASTPVLTLTRTARTTTTPISRLQITTRTDRLEIDYLIEA